MTRTNKINQPFSTLIRNGIIFVCVAALMLSVAPSFAQDNSQTGDSAQSGEISPETLGEIG